MKIKDRNTIKVSNVECLKYKKNDYIWCNNFDNCNNSKYIQVEFCEKLYAFVIVNNLSSHMDVSFQLFKIININRVLDEFFKVLFQRYPEYNKITTYTIEGDWFGQYLLKKQEFELELRLRKHYLIESKRTDCLVWSKFR